MSATDPPALDRDKATAAPADHGLKGRTAWGAALALLLLFQLSLYVPWITSLPPDDLDASWLLLLHWAHVHRLAFGKDVVFTFGPWGFILQGYFPETYGFLVGGWALFTIALFGGLVELAKRLTPRRWAAALWMAAVIALAGSSPVDARIYAVSLVLLVLHFCADDRPLTWAKIVLVLAMALSSQMKFTMALTALMVLMTVSVETLWRRRRRAPWLLLIFLLAYLGLWLAANQPLGNLGPYLAWSWEVARGYTQGEASTNDRVTPALLFLACCLPLFVALGLIHPWRAKPAKRVAVEGPPLTAVKSLLGAAALAGVLLMIFKVGYVRHDEHEITATSALAVLWLLYAAAIWPRLPSRVGQILVGLGVAGSLSLAWYSQQVYGHRSLAGLLAETVTALPRRAEAAGQWMTRSSAVHEWYDQSVQPFRRHPLPVVRGSVDILPYGQDALIAEGLDCRSLPVLGSYLAYTSRLAQLNADFLAGPLAPGTILYNVCPIEYHYASQEDALALPLLLTLYDVEAYQQGLVVLRRSPHPRNFTLIPIDQHMGQLVPWQAVPQSSDPIWVRIGVEMTPMGKLRQAVYKVPPILIGIKTADGQVRVFRLMPYEAESGFLLSPLISDPLSLALLGGNDWAETSEKSRVTQIAVAVGTDSGKSSAYEPQYWMAFSRLQFAHRDLSQVPGIAEELRFRRLVSEFVILHADAVPQISSDSGKTVYLAPAACTLLVSLPPGKSIVHLGFGMLASSYREGKTDGVEFRVVAIRKVTPRGVEGDVIWRRRLDPLNVEADRGPQQVDLSLPEPAPGGLTLQTVPGPSHTASLSYWTDIQFR
ncbi:MAG: hypothetical protein ABR964_14050 [Tepidisphaeraceae bacterium]|jgi:hypothetical protein